DDGFENAGLGIVDGAGEGNARGYLLLLVVLEHVGREIDQSLPDALQETLLGLLAAVDVDVAEHRLGVALELALCGGDLQVQLEEIGRASCRERVWRWGVAAVAQEKTKE